MRLIGNVVWLVFGGFIGMLVWFIAGLLVCLTIVGIPFGVQCFKIAGLVLWPFGKDVRLGDFGMGGLLGNILWIIILGWELAILHLCLGMLFSITIVGIPFGLQHFKFARLALLPFGAKIIG